MESRVARRIRWFKGGSGRDRIPPGFSAGPASGQSAQRKKGAADPAMPQDGLPGISGAGGLEPADRRTDPPESLPGGERQSDQEVLHRARSDARRSNRRSDSSALSASGILGRRTTRSKARRRSAQRARISRMRRRHRLRRTDGRTSDPSQTPRRTESPDVRRSAKVHSPSENRRPRRRTSRMALAGRSRGRYFRRWSAASGPCAFGGAGGGGLPAFSCAPESRRSSSACADAVYRSEA